MSPEEARPPRRVWAPALVAGFVCAAVLAARLFDVLPARHAGGAVVAALFWLLDLGSARFHMTDPAEVRRAVRAYFSPALLNVRQPLGAVLSAAGGLLVAFSPSAALTFCALVGWGVLCTALIVWQGGRAERLARDAAP